jgi:uncharacterized protein
MNKTQKHLYEYIKTLEIIDAHEHLPCERDRLRREIDVFTLMHLYEYVDMTSAGYQPREGENIFANNLFTDESVRLDEKWQRIEKPLESIKHGSYYRPMKIVLKEIYVIDDLNAGTYREANARIAAENTPGLYRRILRDMCNIKTCLVQNGAVENQDPADIFVPVFSDVSTYTLDSPAFVKLLEKHYGCRITSLDEYIQLLEQYIEKMHSLGAAGFKMAANPNVEPDIEKARTDFRNVLAGQKADINTRSTVLDAILKKCASIDMPVAVHCGVWWDYRTVDSKNMIDLVQRHPDTRFDLYHLGIPDVRDTFFIAKNFPNAYINLCWCYIVSQTITERAVNEIIDTVPINKVFGFGADTCWSIEHVYGHYIIMAETLSAAFAQRVDKGLLSIKDAEHILKLWLCTNPERFYKLNGNSEKG